MRLAPLLIVPVVAAFGLSGCRDQQVTSYRVPKETPPPPPAAAPHQHTTAPATAPAEKAAPPAAAPAANGTSMANTPVATASGPGLTWSGPAHWEAKGASGMRKGTFTIPGEAGASAELAITAFPGDVGGDVANVNRWRGQIQLPPQAPDEVLRSIQRLEANGLKMGVVEMSNNTGGTPTRVLGAMVPHEGATWFFKITGPDALVAKEKAAFLEFLKTVRPTSG